MKFSKMFLVSLMSFPLFFSCSNDDDVPVAPVPGAFENGFFVLNEGNATTGSVTFVSNDLNTVKQDVYVTVNPSDNIGGYAQSIFFDGDKAFIISNGSNKITVVNRYTFKLIAKITTGLSIPRYGVVVNGKAYVTNANTFSYSNPTTGDTDDFVAVINLSNYTVENTIPLGTFGEKITAVNGKIYVANGAFGDGNSMKIISPSTNTVVKTLTFGNSPNSMFEKNGSLYVLCSSYAANSELAKIDLTTDTVSSTIVMDSALGNAQNLSFDNNKFFFSIDSKIYDEDITATTIATTPLFTSSAVYLYGMIAKNSRIYVADSPTFTADGKAFIYSSIGTLQKEVAVGLGPNGFYFN
jgi:hypothetical protein